jgi:hypothetical protein
LFVSNSNCVDNQSITDAHSCYRSNIIFNKRIVSLVSEALLDLLSYSTTFFSLSHWRIYSKYKLETSIVCFDRYTQF